MFNKTLKSDSDVKKSFEDLHGGRESDFKNISNLLTSNWHFLGINNGLIDHDIEERYNFKPVYAASSYIQGLDFSSIQNFEQTFFNDYSLLK